MTQPPLQFEPFFVWKIGNRTIVKLETPMPIIWGVAILVAAAVMWRVL
jgi:hypothetical protein